MRRPVWRSFRARFLPEAVAHVRAGGHAVVVDPTGLAEALLPVDGQGMVTDLGLWALLAIGQQHWERVTAGEAEGLARAVIDESNVSSVLDWCERDGSHEGATRKLLLNCTACAACCHDGDVVLTERDLARFREAGRPDLAGRGFVRRSREGKRTLRMAPGGRCKLLAEDRLCTVYKLRPDNCRAFLMGSEACLAAREETLGLRDGAPLG